MHIRLRNLIVYVGIVGGALCGCAGTVTIDHHGKDMEGSSTGGTDSKPVLLPTFPWPVPKPSAMASLPFLDTMEYWRRTHTFPSQPSQSLVGPVDLDDFYRNGPTLGVADKALNYLLEGSGYDEVRYFSLPRGFAIVTRMEQIDSDGLPMLPVRWDIGRSIARAEPFNIGVYLRALFFAPPGRYRIIVFLFSSKALAVEGSMTVEEAEELFSSGGNSLPYEMAIKQYGRDINFYVLVYEFEKSVDEEAAKLRRPGLPITQHLKGAKLTGLMP